MHFHFQTAERGHVPFLIIICKNGITHFGTIQGKPGDRKRLKPLQGNYHNLVHKCVSISVRKFVRNDQDDCEDESHDH